MDVGERSGALAGWLLAPVTGTLSLLRRARMFHPEGACTPVGSKLSLDRIPVLLAGSKEPL
ncbi:MAG: hypothetical protein E6J84_04775 [Deltaproteobacteria bacterium]|nr:MAG: hypothetical protein E6J84_04775 [Deltaproteobacteria bacterium]